jgi:hypothetical protein
VAELVDALGSGSSGCTPVRVQIPASAPFFARINFPSSQSSIPVLPELYHELIMTRHV